jgi:hypothetical protein
MIGMKYENATFRILVDGKVQIEVSIKGCADERESVFPHQLGDTARLMARIAKALRRIEQQEDHERGKRAALRSRTEHPPSANAVVPHATSTGMLSTRAKKEDENDSAGQPAAGPR